MNFEDLISRLLRPSEECLNCLEFRYTKGNEKRRRVVAVIASKSSHTHACLLVLKRKTPTVLSIRHVLPIHSEFNFSIAQAKPQQGATSHKERPYYILKIHQKETDIRLETESLDTLQHVCLLLRQCSNGQDPEDHPIFQEYQAYYPKVENKPQETSSTLGDSAHENQETGSPRKEKGTNPFIMVDSDVRFEDFKAIKNGWIAKELRAKELQFCDYFSLNVLVGTWNVNGKAPTESLDPWLLAFDPDSVDVVAIGLQEADLTTGTFIGQGSSVKEEEWSFALEACFAKSKSTFVKVACRQLVGMLVLVYVNEKHVQHVGEVATSSVGCGILGVMGNKGAVSVRMRLYDSYLTFVNSHLAADVMQVDRRNQDFIEICERSIFDLDKSYKSFSEYLLAHPWVSTHMDLPWSGFNEPGSNLTMPGAYDAQNKLMNAPMTIDMCTLFDCDHLFWFGDLNYRVPLPDNEAKQILREEGGIQKLLALDQLATEMKAGRAFMDFKEHPITFMPTFKYDVGTDTFDTSEKRRSPSFCDRILWMKDPVHGTSSDSWISCEHYTSMMEPKMSDHKPVAALLKAKCRQVNFDAKARVYDQIVLDLDRFENDALPDLHVSENVIEFGSVKYMAYTTRSVEIENKGQVVAKFKFISMQEGKPYCKPWCSVHPPFGMLLPGEKSKIDITIHVNSETASSLNFEKDGLNDILILHTKNGKDHFISVSGQWLVSAFGNDLKVLCKTTRDVRGLSVENCIELRDAKKEVKQDHAREPSGQVDVVEAKKKLSVPKESWRLVDFIYRYGTDVNDIFFTRGDADTMEYIRECLDLNLEFDLVAMLEDKSDFMFEEESQSTVNVSCPNGEELSPVGLNLDDPVEEIEMDVDDVIKSKRDASRILIAPSKVAAKSRSVVIHSMVDVLLHLLESLADPVVPYTMHYGCVQEGYHSLIAAKSMVKQMTEEHRHLFSYLVSFLREFRSMYVGETDLGIDKLAQVLAPVLLKTPAKSMIPMIVKQMTALQNRDASGVNVPPSTTGLTNEMSKMNVGHQKYATISGAKGLQSHGAHPDVVLQFFNRMDSSKKEKMQYELRRRMFLMQFLDESAGSP